MRKFLCLLLLISSISHFTVAKSTANPPHAKITKRTCGSDIPSLAWEQNFQSKIQQFLANQHNPQNRVLTNYTIPVIVHVVYWIANQNISQAQVNSQVQILNDDYKGIGVNVGDVPAAFQSLVTDCNISFCLAQKNPSNVTLAQAGIDRVDAQAKGFSDPGGSGWSESYINGTVKPATIWDPTKYMNIWVLPLDNQLLGYATFPAMPVNTLPGVTPADGGTATTDGVVINYTAFGNTGTAENPYDLGRTTSHEVGHWLGLKHIWGDGFCADDYCADTPTQQSANYNCPTYPNVTCSNGPNGDMFMNFMDYTDDNCMFMFTPNQRSRMQTAMSAGTYRSPLASSNVCTSTPAKPIANFSANNTTVCPGNSLSFTDLSSNIPTSWKWTFDHGTPATSNLQSPTVIYNTPGGPYFVKLKVTNALGSDSLTKTGYITVGNSGLSLPFAEGFQATTFPPTGWTLVTHSGFNWDSSRTVGGFGLSSACMRYNNTDNDALGNRDDIFTPTINLTGATSPRLKFDVAYAPYTDAFGQINDTLEVLITDFCSGTTSQIYKKGGTQLSTAPPMGAEFYPTAGQWRKDSVFIPAGYLNKYVKIIFRNFGNYGHTIYIDNVNVYGNATATGLKSFQSEKLTYSVIPNPNKGLFEIKLSSLSNKTCQLKMFNVNGQIILNEEMNLKMGENSKQFNLSGIEKGVYLLSIITEDGAATQNIVVQ